MIATDEVADVTLGLGAHAIELEVHDGTLGDTDSLSVVVEDTQGPAIGAITASADLVQLGSAVQLSADFSDACGEVQSGTWSWGDGSASAAGLAGAGTATGEHTYAAPGVYPVTLELADASGNASVEAYEGYVVVYDAGAGFVTGGGQIDSTAGSYVADPLLTGPASFGFVAKYKKGQTTPDGQTQFQFQAGDLDFHSSSYEWLIVAGARAQLKGEGTIQGAEGTFAFMLTAIDGQQSGGGGEDRLRIRIWELGGGVVYDNQVEGDTSDSATPDTVISRGQIVIHN